MKHRLINQAKVNLQEDEGQKNGQPQIAASSFFCHPFSCIPLIAGHHQGQGDASNCTPH
ncbi:hypothetical protein [Novipirellula sp.]|uniref:hypothetical protein n=1 Tax=Novipirellula sp. TaxID=2795430 RepID=UPI003569C50E